MKTPSDDEINARIADFMGWSKNHASSKYIYHAFDFSYVIKNEPTESLDALVPVVEKLDNRVSLVKSVSDHGWAANVYNIFKKGYPQEYMLTLQDKSPSRALALAIYKVLENET